MKTTLLILSILFSGCSQKAECIPKEIYLTPEYPRLKTLYSVKPYQITDIKPLDDRYIAVAKTQLESASTVSHKVRRQNNFYVKQINTYNERFVE